MNVAIRLGAFGLALAVALGGGYAVGRAAGPIDESGPGDDGPPAEQPHHPPGHEQSPEVEDGHEVGQ